MKQLKYYLPQKDHLTFKFNYMIDYLNTSTSNTATSPSCARETMRGQKYLTTPIDVSALSNGLYFITIIQGGQLLLQNKFLILKND
ncbi:MAG: hypothetical protein IPL48_03475 [Bacteroidetes bacterium]|nr:hypothetical protein [Bacteroidota bacterium]